MQLSSDAVMVIEQLKKDISAHVSDPVARDEISEGIGVLVGACAGEQFMNPVLKEFGWTSMKVEQD